MKLNFAFLGTILLTSFMFSNAYGEGYTFPSFLESKPVYSVRYVTSKGTPNPTLQLTERALRILPSFLTDIPPLKKKPYMKSVDGSRIIVSPAENKTYCDNLRNFCWPKKMHLENGFIAITDSTGKTTYYKDEKKLSTFLWAEMAAPLKTLGNDS